MQMFLSSILEEDLFTPVVTDHIQDALEKIIIKDPLLIIIDMMMPDHQGIKMYRQLKEHDKFKTLPVIMLSTLEKHAFFQLENIEYTLPHHGLPKPEGFLQKPPETEELIAVIKNILKPNPKRKTKCL